MSSNYLNITNRNEIDIKGVKDILSYDDEKVICPNCHHSRSVCGSCIHSTTCLFETDPDPMPKVVVQQMRNGNTVIQQQVRNPAREEKFCKNCKCYNEEFHWFECECGEKKSTAPHSFVNDKCVCGYEKKTEPLLSVLYFRRFFHRFSAIFQ